MADDIHDFSHLRPKPRRRLPVVVRFGIQILVGVAVFVLVSAAAVALSVWVDHLESFRISEYIIVTLRGFEFFLFAVDALCFLVFLLVEAAILIRAMIHQLGEDL